MLDGNDWLLFSLLSHVTVVLGALAYAMVVRRDSWLSPIVQFLVFLELFTIPLPIRALQTLEIENDVTPYLPQILDSLAPSLWLVTVGVLVFVTVYYYPGVARTAGHLPPLRTRRDRSPYVAAAGLGLFSLFLIATLARGVGGIIPFILLGYGGTAEMFGRGYLAAGFPWFFIASTLLLVRYAQRRERRDLLLFAVWFGGITLMNVVMGQRNIMVYEGITLVVFWHLAIAPVRPLRFAPIAIAGFLALNLLGLIRSSKFESPGEVVDRLTNTFSGIQESGDLHHGIIYTLTTGEFVVPFETLPMVMHASEEQVPIRWGSTLGITLSLFVPSALWPGRPLQLGNWYMSTFYGAGYGLNEGRAFYFLTEGWLNFGPVGVLLVMAIWGYGWGVVGAYAKRPALDPAAALLIALLVAFLERCIAGDSASITVGVAQQSILPLIPVYLYLVRVDWGDATSRRVNEPGALLAGVEGS